MIIHRILLSVFYDDDSYLEKLWDTFQSNQSIN